MTGATYSGMLITRNNGIQVASMGDELGMMNLETGKYYLLDQVGSAIWHMLKAPMSLDEIVEGLLEIYDVTMDQCRDDVSAFILELIEKKILEAK